MRRYRTLAIGPLVLAVAMLTTLSVAGGEMKQATRFQQKGARALENGDIPGAEKHFTKSLSAMPSFPAAHIGLGQIAMSRKDFEGVVLEFLIERARWPAGGLVTLRALKDLDRLVGLGAEVAVERSFVVAAIQ